MRILIYHTSNPSPLMTGINHLKKAGIETIQLTEKQLKFHGGSKSSLAAPFVHYLIKKILGKTKPTVIHVHGVRTSVAFSLFRIAHKLNIPLVATLHSYRLVCPITHYVQNPSYIPCDHPYLNRNCKLCVSSQTIQNPVLGPFSIVFRQYMSSLRGTYRYANVLISPSLTLSQLLNGIGYRNLKYLPNPVGEDFLAATPEISRYEKAKMCFFGRLQYSKGVTLLPIIAKHFPHIKLYIVGRGPLQGWLLDQKHSNIVFHGFLEGDALINLVKDANLVLVPSICQENFPSVILEAFALGKPVIGFDLGGVKELVESANGGLLAKPFSIRDLCDNINNLISDPVKQAELGSNGRRWVEEISSPKQYAKTLIRIYDNVAR